MKVAQTTVYNNYSKIKKLKVKMPLDILLKYLIQSYQTGGSSNSILHPQNRK